MKNIFRKREFLSRIKILKLQGAEATLENLNKILLLNETENQRTYLVKSDKEFFIINDNLGDVKIALRRTIERLKFNVFESSKHYLVKLEGISPEIKVSKIVFNGIEDVYSKIKTL